MFFCFLKNSGFFFGEQKIMNSITKNEAFHQRLALLIGTEEPFRWAKRMGIPSATFARIWNNYDIPKHEHLCRIAQRCAVSLDWLLMGKADSSSMEDMFAFVSLVGLANCGIAQGWFNESDLSNRILLPSFMASEEVFAVLCRGFSMAPVGIKDGNVCVVYPNRPVEFGKPVLIRTKAFVENEEVSLSTIKILESEDEDTVSLCGWLDPDETGNQSMFTEKRSKSCITLIAPIGNILQIKMPEKESQIKQDIDKEILVECLETLHSLYERIDSQKFAQAVLFLYEKTRENSSVDMETIRSLMEIIGSQAADSKL